jgi:hypothetical protein
MQTKSYFHSGANSPANTRGCHCGVATLAEKWSRGVLDWWRTAKRD